MRVIECWLVLLAACSFEHGTETRRDATPDDDAERRIDAAPPDASASCSTTGLPCVGSVVANPCNGACWVKCTSTVAIASQAAASTACETWGGELAPLRTSADQQCAAALFPAQAHWIGFEQANSATQVASGWSWNSDGVTPTFIAWGGGQPNDMNGSENGAEQCAFMNTAGEWHDLPCSDGGLHRFSCRR